MVVVLAHGRRVVQKTVRTFAVRVSKFLVSNVRDREMGEVEGIAEKSKGNYRERVEVRPTFEEDKLKTEFTSGRSFRVARVVPPFCLRFVMCRQITRQIDLIVFGTVPQRVRLFSHRIEKCTHRALRDLARVIQKRFKKSCV